MSRRVEGFKGFWVWILVLFISLVLHGLPKTYQNKIASLGRTVFFSPFLWIDSQYDILRDNLAKLIRAERELARAKLEIQSLTEAKIENQRLRRLLEFKENTDYDLVLAEVVGRKVGRFPSTVVIDRGSADGVARGMPVITPDGVVGKIKSAGVNSSVVQILLDPSIRISAIDQRSRVNGIVRSPDGVHLVMEQVPVGEDVAPGDRIVTSGYGGVFPPGLLIGYVSEVSEPEGSMFKKIEVQPAAKLNRFEEVFVLVEIPQDSIFGERTKNGGSR
ncbi:MAG TPA: rod shape-determining protein MreC [candidate division Zixibacteria bacterium]|nr:rod shape-determining protein MreC [candidate division Zixibacteria bacterium]